MEGDLSGDAFDVEKESKGKAHYSFAIDGVISIPCIDQFL